MKLISWNLNGLEDRNLDVRTEAAMIQILLGAPIEAALTKGFKANIPDIVLLQEVVEHTYHAHIMPHLKAAGFSVFPQALGDRSYFEVVAIRSDKIEASYESFEYSLQGRGLTTLKFNDLTVMTAHLESMKPGTEYRIAQTKFILNKMRNTGTCIFAGDTNLREAEWESLNTDDIQDAWIEVGAPKVHQMTWIYGNSKSRFDRAWAHQVEILNFETFGKEKIPAINERPSDHMGLRIEFSV